MSTIEHKSVRGRPCKLSQADKHELRRYREAGVSIARLASMWHLAPTTVHKILAADAPGSTSEASHRADPTDWLAYLEAKPECEPYLSIARAWRVDKAEILRLMRGEFICSRCYLRKDGESDDVVTF